MGDFFSANYPNKVWGLVFVLLIAWQSGCKEVDPENPKCYDQESAWAKGERYNTDGERVNYVEVPSYDQNVEEGKEIKWVYLRLADSPESIGAVKFRELMMTEVPQGANPGDFVKLLIRIDQSKWEFAPDISNVKVGGYSEVPPEDISPATLNTYKGTATQKTGAEWEYFEVVLPRYQYYSIHVEARLEVVCTQ